MALRIQVANVARRHPQILAALADGKISRRAYPGTRVAALLAPGDQMQGATTKADHPATMGRVGARAESIVEEERHRTTSLLRRPVPAPSASNPECRGAPPPPILAAVVLRRIAALLVVDIFFHLYAFLLAP